MLWKNICHFLTKSTQSCYNDCLNWSPYSENVHLLDRRCGFLYYFMFKFQMEMFISNKTAICQDNLPTWSHLPLNKMATIFADDIFKWIFLNQYGRFSIQISLKFVPKSPIDNKPALVQVMAWCRTGDEPLPESMMTLFTDAYMRHQG